MRHLFAACLLAGCQPMYGPAEPMHHVPTHPHPVTTTPEPPIVYNEVCNVDFRRDAHTVKRQHTTAVTHVNDGDASIASSATASTANARVDLVIRGIQHYADALRADPYDAGATLKLAVAYDEMLHKGCALALLHRLDSLAQNPKLAPDATQRIDDIVDNPQWFKGYRKDALAAVNRNP